MRRRTTDRGVSETSLVRLSTEAMVTTQLKNEHERWRFKNIVKQLNSNEQCIRQHAERELDLLKEEYLKMLAYGIVYKDHSFGKYDSTASGECGFSSHPTTNSEYPVKRSSPSKSQYLDTSSRITSGGQLFPSISTQSNATQQDTSGKVSHWDRLRSPRHRQYSENETESNATVGYLTPLKSSTEVNFTMKSPRSMSTTSSVIANDANKDMLCTSQSRSVTWHDNMSSKDTVSGVSTPKPKLLSLTDQVLSQSPVVSSPIPSSRLMEEETYKQRVRSTDQIIEEHGEIDEETEEEKRTKLALMSAIAIKLQALIMWKQTAGQPAPPRASSEQRFHRRKSVYVESLKPMHVRPRSLFPGDCKTIWGMKKFLEKEADNKLSILHSAPKRNRAKLDKLIEKAKLPALIDRGKTTSAIFRDFKVYKDSLKEDNDTREKHVIHKPTVPLLATEDSIIDIKI